MIAIRAEELLQIVVRPWQAGHDIASEQARPVAPRHLQEVLERLGQSARGPAVARQRTDQAAVATPHPRGVLPLLVPQDRRRTVDPAEGQPDVRPRRFGRLQALAQDRPQAGQFLREPLFDSTRSRLAATSASRFCSFSPDASRGGRPSSVNAERTAAQSPRITSASASCRPSTFRSIGRMPRTFFFNWTLAWRSASYTG